jgi:hypothetical protein
MDQHAKRKLETELLTMGLAKLNSPELIAQLASMINQWPGDKHEFLMGLINECDDKDRSEMYNAIRPHLKFKPLSLETYVSRIAERAGAMVSQRRMRVEGSAPKPIQVGDASYVKVPPALATGVVITLRCYKCPKVEKFVSDTQAGGMIAGRKAGWTREPGVNKEVCADCKSKEVAHEVAVLGRDTVMVITDKRRVVN